MNANRFQDLHSEINMSTAFRRCFNLKPFGTMVSVWLRLLPQLLTSDKLAPEYMIRHGPTICHDHFANIPQRNVQINAQFEKRILKKLKPKKNSGSPSIRRLLFFYAKNGAKIIENDAETIQNGAETKHLNSTRTARPPKGLGSSSRSQMLKSSRNIRKVRLETER